MPISKWTKGHMSNDPLKIEHWSVRGAKTTDGGNRGVNNAVVVITLSPRPTYCDRGNWIARTEQLSGFPEFDSADGFPRYYFDLDRAKAEMEDMLKKRGF